MWMNQENGFLKKPERKRSHIVWLYLCETSRKGKSIGSRIDEWLPENWKGGKLKPVANRNGVSY